MEWPARHAYMTLPEVAEHYRAQIETVRYWRKIGYGPHGVLVGGRVLYPLAEVERFDAELAKQIGAAG